MMKYENIENCQDALVYITEGNLSTVVIMAFKDSRDEQEYISAMTLAQIGIDFIKQFNIVVFNSRINEIIESNLSVKDWAKQWEENSEYIFHNPIFGKKQAYTNNIKIEINETKYKELIGDQKLLRALEECGVDNWEGYADAVNLASYD